MKNRNEKGQFIKGHKFKRNYPGWGAYNGYFSGMGPGQAYWLGFIAGDGSIGRYGNFKSKHFSMALKKKDDYHLKTLANLLGYSTDYVKYSREKVASLQIASKRLYDDLIKRGIRPRKANNIDEKIIPDNYFWQFFLGLFDADGHIGIYYSKKEKIYRFSVFGQEKLITEIKNRTGIDVGSLIKHKNGKLSYQLTGRVQIKKLLKLIYKDSSYFLKRKKEIANKILREEA